MLSVTLSGFVWSLKTSSLKLGLPRVLLLRRRRYLLFIGSLWEASTIALIVSGSCTATISFEALTYLGGKSQQKLANDRIHGLQKVTHHLPVVFICSRLPSTRTFRPGDALLRSFSRNRPAVKTLRSAQRGGSWLTGYVVRPG